MYIDYYRKEKALSLIQKNDRVRRLEILTGMY